MLTKVLYVISGLRRQRRAAGRVGYHMSSDPGHKFAHVSNPSPHHASLCDGDARGSTRTKGQIAAAFTHSSNVPQDMGRMEEESMRPVIASKEVDTRVDKAIEQ